MTDEPKAGPFHSFALWAYMEVAAEFGQWPPDSEATRRQA
jgi:hypothetical protein